MVEISMTLSWEWRECGNVEASHEVVRNSEVTGSVGGGGSLTGSVGWARVGSLATREVQEQVR